jgi:photosystem II stability/assembly factor-like uncharacterized protein
VFRSTNGGDNWTAINTGLIGTFVNALAVDPITPSNLYAGRGDSCRGASVFRSDDGGESWTAINNGVPNTTISALALAAGTPSILYAGTPIGVFRSIDGGGSWTAINTGLSNLSILTLVVDPAAPAVYAGTLGNGAFVFGSTGNPDAPFGLQRTNVKR